MTYTRMDDWWCYGLILYQIFHGTPLFNGDTINDIEEQKNTKPRITIKPSEKMFKQSSAQIVTRVFNDRRDATFWYERTITKQFS